MSMGPDVDRAAAMALRSLVACRVRALPVNPAELLGRCRNTQLLSLEEAAELLDTSEAELAERFSGAEAWTYRFQTAQGQVLYLVCCKKGGHPGRLRFSLAHELGHIVLGHQRSGWREEAEANCYASHLLFPRPVLRRLAAQGQPLYAEQLAQVFYTSVAAVEALARQRVCHVSPALEAQVEVLLRDALPEHLPQNRRTALWRPIVLKTL